tara:strand:+ start:4333 stop:7629 length:3297 start_codon:yes stop_codon:yes gene_type:complete
MIRFILSVASAVMFTFSIVNSLAAQTYIHNWQFSDSGGTLINAASNTGSIGTLFNNGGPKVGGGYLNFGQTPSYKYPFNSFISSSIFRKAQATSVIADSGIYRLSFRVADWNLVGAGTNNGVGVQFGSDEGLMRMDFEVSNNGTDIRVQSAASNDEDLYSADGDKQTTLGTTGLVSNGAGVIIEVTTDLYTGIWSSRAKVEGEGENWYPLVTDGLGFTKLDQVGLLIEGKNTNAAGGTGWTTGNYVRFDYITVEKLSSNYIQNWDFEDDNGSSLTTTTNSGFDGALWDSDGPRLQGGNLNIGDTPGYKWQTPGVDGGNYIDSTITKTAAFGDALERGIYRMEFRVADWDFDGTNADGEGTTNNGIKIQVGSSGGLASLEFEPNASGTDVRVRSANSNNGSLSGTDKEYGVGSQGLVGTQGVIVQLTANLYSGEWSTRAKIDTSSSAWADLVTDGTGFYSIDHVKLIAEGANDTGWEAGHFVKLDYVQLKLLEANVVQSWEFDNEIAELSAVENGGSDDASFSTNGSNPYNTRSDGTLLIGSLDSLGPDSSVTRTADFNQARDSGTYLVEFRVNEWDFDADDDGTGVTGNGFKVQAGDAPSLVTIEFEVSNNNDYVRVRSQGSNSGNLSGTDTQSQLSELLFLDSVATGSPVIVQLLANLDTGVWSTRAKLDIDTANWIDLVQDGTGFTSLDTLRIVADGSAGQWQAGEFVAIDYVTVRNVGNFIQNWQFDDANGTTFPNVVNAGDDRAVWSQNGPRTFNGVLNIGDTPFYKWNENDGAEGTSLTNKTAYRTADFNRPLTSGTYRLEFRVADWDMDGNNDGEGTTGNGIFIQFGSSDGLANLNFETAQLNGTTGLYDDIRVRSDGSTSGTLDGSNKQNQLGDQEDLDGDNAVIVQLTANLDTGVWSSRTKIDDANNTWRDLVTDGTGFNKLDTVKLVLDGSAAEWEAGEFILLDYITVERLSAAVPYLFTDWMSDYTVNSNVNFYDDPDGDGKENGLEHAFSTDPSVSDTSGISQLAMVGNSGSFTHPLNPVLSEDVSITYEWSTDLQSFHASGATVGDTTVVLTPSENLQVLLTTVTANITGTVPANLFVRVSVSQSE